nr:Do family serine endopeptidase [Govania unica]
MAIGIAALAGVQPAGAQTVPSFADLAAKVLPSVVNITVTKTVEGQPGIEEFLRRFGAPGAGPDASPAPGGKGQGKQDDSSSPRQRATGGGTGFVVDPSGIIVTNSHVIEDADGITVKLQSGEEFKAEVIGSDPATDVAVIRIKPGRALTPVAFGNSDMARVGDWVLTIGNPYGLAGSVTAGIISARNRDINTGLYDDFIQTDSPINPGNSGGPMFNMKGEVIGINTAIFSPSGGNAGIGFSIPANLAKTVVAQLRESGKVKRGWLGVSFQPISKDLADSLGLKSVEGALVASVVEDGPAAKAGIISGDILLEYNGNKITQMQRLPGLVANTPIGKSVPVVVLRKNQNKSLLVKIVERKEEGDKKSPGVQGKDSGAGKEKSVLGLSLAPLTDDLRGSLGLAKGIKGVVVVNVDANSNATAQGLRRGDVIVSVSLEDVTSPEDVVKRVEDARKNGRPSVLFRVFRGGNYSHITVPFK